MMYLCFCIEKSPKYNHVEENAKVFTKVDGYSDVMSLVIIESDHGEQYTEL